MLACLWSLYLLYLVAVRRSLRRADHQRQWDLRRNHIILCDHILQYSVHSRDSAHRLEPGHPLGVHSPTALFSWHFLKHEPNSNNCRLGRQISHKTSYQEKHVCKTVHCPSALRLHSARLLSPGLLLSWTPRFALYYWCTNSHKL